MKRTIFLIAALLTLLPAVAHATFPGRNGAIVYGKWSERVPGETNSSQHTFTLESQGLDGRTRTLVDCGPCVDAFSPTVSPDGSTVAFSLGGSIELMSIDGTDRRRIPFRANAAGDPAFSPRGTRLAFTTTAGISIGNLDGSGVRRLVSNALAPAWSSRGWIAFVRHDAVYRVRPDGRGLRLLVRNAVMPAWSPDGKQLAFSRPRRMVGHGLLVSDGDGRRVRRLRGRDLDVDICDVAWSPDGRRLVLGIDGGPLIVTDRHGVTKSVLRLHGGEMVTPMRVDWQPLPR